MSGRRSSLLACAAVLLLAAIRFRDFLAGGVLSFRDAGFFFVPWRTLLARQLAAGVFPSWNDALGCGRAFAADPNAAVFWPLTPLLLALSPTALALLNAAAALVLMVLAARWAGLPAAAATVAGAVLLFSGVFQTLPLLFTSMASVAPLPFALVAAARLARGEGGRARPAAVLALALGLSALGGEPALAAIGGAGAFSVLLFAGGLRRTGVFAGAALLGVALAAVQVLPTAALLSRAARGRTERAEAGALFFSVRPGRVLTLLEPRLVGDPFAEKEEEYWGAATFDAGNPYFYDVALGLLPLLFALAAATDGKARPFLGAAAAGAVLSCGRFLPGLGALLARLSVFRYPEKWWVLATLGLALAAAFGADAVARRERRALSALRTAGFFAAALLGLGALLAAAAPGALRTLLFGAGLGAGPVSPERMAQLLLPRLAAGALAALLLGLLARASGEGRLGIRPLLLVAAGLFLVDATVRVAGALPAGAPDLFTRAPEDVRAVLAAQGSGRFYDDGADVRELAVARAGRAGGFDPLRPAAGAVFGIRYAAENDIDRMTPRASFAFARNLAALPWGEEKIRLLRLAGVTAVRTAAPGPDPAGVRVLRASGPDRILAVEGSRPLFSLEPGGRLTVVAARPGRQELAAETGPGGARLAVARSFDAGWRATVDGAPARLLPADGPFAALDLPPGPHRVTLAYQEPLFAWGGALSILALAGIAVLFRR